ncbi:Right handed beta helix region [Andreprevotia lacus DSM 23236]|jgi:hypothetical protein|uniref:Right handed beta helix region n=1 Tax=Andreprevotia lacus DSM 23236 TaxID=1121001 RepID=A0A1W1XV16_9NEIS|nr:right-handed parallel beta-helix repeat-containing protein [Andreprevotia lacus]SMC27746.1 Right handed beta helix region [Andreprevotia lacus DSM 23236]
MQHRTLLCRWRPRQLATLAPLTLLAALASQHAAAGDYYVDCSNTTSAQTGTLNEPWNTLAQANQHYFLPGDNLWFKRSSLCRGSFKPQGAGAAGNPVRVDAYGSGALPELDGYGANSTVWLHNLAWWELRRLSITNSVQPAGAQAQGQRGVYVTLQDYGTGSHYVLQQLNIHDIAGYYDETVKNSGKYACASGGIVIEALSPVGTDPCTISNAALPANTPAGVPSSFDDVLIDGNTLNNVARQGIYSWSYWRRRAELGNAFGVWPNAGSWAGWTNVRISNNQLGNIGSDGIQVTNSSDALVEHNVLKGFHTRGKTAQYAAGMWAVNADRTVFRFNEASGGQTTMDGMAFDIDHATRDTVFEYNFSHDNQGGFLLLCNKDGEVHDGGIVRYNISYNDSYQFIKTCDGPVTNVKVYNNTVYVPSGTKQALILSAAPAKQTIALLNNIFTHGGSASEVTLGQAKSSTYLWDHNLFYNYSAIPTDAYALTTVPLLNHCNNLPALQSGNGYKLQAGSPAAGSGVSIASPGSQDYYGNPIPLSGVNRGAYQGSAQACTTS